MDDQKQKLAWLVRNTINMDDDANARHWAGVFQVSDLDLATAVMIVGADAKAVAKFFGDTARGAAKRRLRTVFDTSTALWHARCSRKAGPDDALEPMCRGSGERGRPRSVRRSYGHGQGTDLV